VFDVIYGDGCGVGTGGGVRLRLRRRVELDDDECAAARLGGIQLGGAVISKRNKFTTCVYSPNL
jgi:hypothetical protein